MNFLLGCLIFKVRAISFNHGNMAPKMRVAKRDVVSKLLGKGYQSMCLASRSVLKNEVKDFKKKQNQKKGLVFQKTSETWSLGHSLPSSWNDNLDPVGLEPLSFF